MQKQIVEQLIKPNLDVKYIIEKPYTICKGILSIEDGDIVREYATKSIAIWGRSDQYAYYHFMSKYERELDGNIMRAGMFLNLADKHAWSEERGRTIAKGRVIEALYKIAKVPYTMLPFGSKFVVKDSWYTVGRQAGNKVYIDQYHNVMNNLLIENPLVNLR